MLARRLTIPLVVGLVASAWALAVPAGAAVPDVYAPGSSPFGKSYGEWNAQWWTTMSQTVQAPGHPFADGAVKCSGVNDGRVVFLAGTTSGTATRSCKIPSSKAVLLPLVNFVCFDAGKTEQELRDDCSFLTSFVTSLEASVDGDAIPATTLFSLRAPSPPGVFAFTLVDNNTLGFAPDSGPAVADGYYVMLKPLPRGTHTLVFGGSAPALAFSTQATYTLTVHK